MYLHIRNFIKKYNVNNNCQIFISRYLFFSIFRDVYLLVDSKCTYTIQCKCIYALYLYFSVCVYCIPT